MEKNKLKHAIVLVIPSIRNPQDIPTLNHSAALLFALRDVLGQHDERWRDPAIVVSDSRLLPPSLHKSSSGRTVNGFFTKSETHKIPTYHFDHVGQCEFQGSFAKESTLNVGPLASVFEADFSYGAGRDKGFIAAGLLDADRVFFADDDTYMSQHLFTEHLRILEPENADFVNILLNLRLYTGQRESKRPPGKRGKVTAVTGGYCGARSFDVLIFPELDQQRQWEELVAPYMADDSPSGADKEYGSPTDRIVGGNFLIRREVYERLCCPVMSRTPVTDDVLLGKLVAAVMEPENIPWEVRKSDCPTMHVQFESRHAPAIRKAYLVGWARTVAFWCLFDATWVKYFADPAGTQPQISPVRRERALQRVREFGERLGTVWGPGLTFGANENVRRSILEASHEISDNPSALVDEVQREIGSNYVSLRQAWPRIIKFANDKGP